jgi:hypothetical protein
MKTDVGTQSLVEKLIQALAGLLAPIIDRFKAKNPIVWAVIQAILFTLQYFFMNGPEWGIFPPDLEWVSTLLQIITWILAALVGSRTFKFMKKNTA